MSGPRTSTKSNPVDVTTLYARPRFFKIIKQGDMHHRIDISGLLLPVCSLLFALKDGLWKRTTHALLIPARTRDIVTLVVEAPCIESAPYCDG